MTAGSTSCPSETTDVSSGMIHRDPADAARQHYDVIVVGGGVYGIMTALEATRRGLRPLLLERADFGGATSHNSLRIVHGGLRYLQSLNLRRSLESIRERAWWLRHFPELVRPLPCLMPLYGDGVRRPFVMRLGLRLNDLLCDWQERDAALPGGRVVDAASVRRLWPEVDPKGLLAGAMWHDAVIVDAPRLLIEALRWACEKGTVALNYVEAGRLLEAAGRVAGVEGRDLETAETHLFQAPVVVNAAGPWSRSFAANAGVDEPRLFQPVLAWNVSFRRAPPSDHALAIRARQRGAQTYFLLPHKESIMAGTGYAPWRDEGGVQLRQSMMQTFIDELNAAMPGLGMRTRDVIRTYVGLLPAAAAGTEELAQQDLVVDHGATRGPIGFFSVSGVKLTTARVVAERVVACAFPSARPIASDLFDRARPLDRPSAESPPAAPGRGRWLRTVRTVAHEEAALHLNDLLLRRLPLCDDPEGAIAVAPLVCQELGWNHDRTRPELKLLGAELDGVRLESVSRAQPSDAAGCSPKPRP